LERYSLFYTNKY